MDINVGFIGCGTLGSSVATGLCKAPEFTGKIVISEPTNKTKAETVKKNYPDKVILVDSHAELLENATIIFPSIVPDILPQVTASLTFLPRHKIVHVASGISLEQATPYYGKAGKVVRAVPLPFASRRMGPMVLYGDDEQVEALFAMFGSLIKVPTERDLEVLAVHTALMVPYYAIINEVVKWSMKKGMAYENARDYICHMNNALSNLVLQDDVKDLDSFMGEMATPGGTNELAQKILTESGAYAPWQVAMEAVGKRYGL
ncbi:MAG: NAD(P)-binding domain-containing protein [Planctomycetaceae bacterium]|nr:NAD(P)-binding domain-containing protein [Planctomycetaceae bacterium]